MMKAVEVLRNGQIPILYILKIESIGFRCGIWGGKEELSYWKNSVAITEMGKAPLYHEYEPLGSLML